MWGRFDHLTDWPLDSVYHQCRLEWWDHRLLWMGNHWLSTFLTPPFIEKYQVSRSARGIRPWTWNCHVGSSFVHFSNWPFRIIYSEDRCYLRLLPLWMQNHKIAWNIILEMLHHWSMLKIQDWPKEFEITLWTWIQSFGHRIDHFTEWPFVIHHQ